MFPAHLASRDQLAQFHAKEAAKEQDRRDAETAAAASSGKEAGEEQTAQPTKHHVVALEGCHLPIPKFDFSHTYTEYANTSPSEVAERIKDATIAIACIVPITKADIDQAPKLQCIAIMTTGIDWLDKEHCAARGISVINCPQSSLIAVAEHCLGLYFAVRRRTVLMHNLTTTTNDWATKGTPTKRFAPVGPPLSADQETLGIIGYGHVGKRVEMLMRAIGVQNVLIAERKRTPPREGRKIFQEVLTKATVLVIACPKDEMTTGLIGREDLRNMRRDACIINIARGGIVNEQALADALRNGWIAGAATDVFEKEPTTLGGSPLLPDVTNGEEPIPNLTVSPHIAWFSGKTIETLQALLKSGVEGWVKGEPVETSVIVLDGKVVR